MSVTIPGSQLAWSALLERVDTALWIFDIDHGRVRWANPRALRLWNASSTEELYARDMKTGMSLAVERRLRQYQSDFMAGDAAFLENWTLYPKGVPCPLQVRFTGALLEDGRMALLCEGYEDNTLKPETLRSTDALLHTRMMISMHYENGQTLYLNPAARTAFAQGRENLQNWFVYPAHYDDVMDRVRSHGETSLTCEVHTSQGTRWHELTVRSCTDPASGKPSLLVSQSDVSELKQAEAYAQRLAHSDPLTHLPNRLALPETFDCLRRRSHAQGLTLALFFIDLDQFKVINDTMGHRAGDELLLDVTQRLRSFCASHDTTALRLGGDEFLLLSLAAEEDAAKTFDAQARELGSLLSITLSDGGRRYLVTPSIGISHYPEHGCDTESLMQCADLAMLQAKQEGRNRYMVFEPRMREAHTQQMQLQLDLQLAIERDEMDVFFQPRFCSRSERIMAAEALVRWRHPERGMISPGVFVPLCEKTGLIEQLGALVLRRALQEQKRWLALGLRVAVSVNVSLRQLSNPSFGPFLADMVRLTGSPPELLELELTESALTEATDVLQKNLDIIRGLGLKISIDDFGTGYSNLARLSEMSVDCIKIDRSFVERLPASRDLVQIVVTMCKLLKAKVVAEGIETGQAVQWVRELGCDEIQGYFYAKPMPAADFLNMLELEFQKINPVLGD